MKRSKTYRNAAEKIHADHLYSPTQPFATLLWCRVPDLPVHVLEDDTATVPRQSASQRPHRENEANHSQFNPNTPGRACVPAHFPGG